MASLLGAMPAFRAHAIRLSKVLARVALGGALTPEAQHFVDLLPGYANRVSQIWFLSHYLFALAIYEGLEQGVKHAGGLTDWVSRAAVGAEGGAPRRMRVRAHAGHSGGLQHGAPFQSPLRPSSTPATQSPPAVCRAKSPAGRR